MTDPETAARMDGPTEQDDSPLSSASAIGLAFFGYLALTLVVLVASAKLVGLL